MAVRRGRPRLDEVATRQAAMLDAALDVLSESGYPGFTMAAVAERAHSSKSTIYSWFTNREGLLRAAIVHHYRPSSSALAIDPTDDRSPRQVLTDWAHGLLQRQQTERSLMLARVTLNDPRVQAVTLIGGADPGRRLLADYLIRLEAEGVLAITDGTAAAKACYGLVIQDDLIRGLYGEPPMSRAEIAARVDFAVDAMLRIFGVAADTD